MVMENHHRKALIYVRVSTKKQAKNFSLATQEKDCREYALGQGITEVAKVLMDVGSGLTMKGRPGLRELCDIARDPSNGILHIIFWELDRFTRRIKDFVNLMEEMVEAGITLHLASEKEQYTQQNATTWVLRAMGAQGESAKISKRTRNGQTAAIMAGLNIGPVPWAYIIEYDEKPEESKGAEEQEPTPEAGRLVPDPEVWPHCLDLWEMAYQGKTPMQIAVHLNQEGVPGHGGGEWTSDAVLYILQNLKYTGCQVRGKKRYSQLPGPPDKTPPIIVQDAHEAAVSLENFERIQEMIAGRHRGQSAPRSHSSGNPFSCIAKCGICKKGEDLRNLVMQQSNGGVKLRCSRKKRSGVSACDLRDLPLDLLLDRFMERFMDVFLTEDTLRTVMETIGDRGRPYLEKQDTRKLNLKGRLREVQGEIKNVQGVVRKYGDKHDAMESLMEDLERIEKERREIKKEIEEINDNDAEVQQYITDPEGVMEKLLDQKTYAEPRDPQLVRALIQLYVERIEIYRDHGVIYYHLGTRKGDQPATDTIYLTNKDQAACDSQEAHDSLDAESCPLEGNMGMSPGSAPRPGTPAGFPRRCGDVP